MRSLATIKKRLKTLRTLKHSDLVEKNQIVKSFPTQVMGYPTIKFFSPGTPAGNMGEERASRDKSVPAIKVLFKVQCMLKILQVVPFPERYGGIPEGAAAEERESRKGMAQPVAC